MKRLSILGSTGSIGIQTLDVVDAFPGEFEVIGLSAGRNITRLCEQITKYKPQLVCVQYESDLEKVQAHLNAIQHRCQCVFGDSGLVEVALSAPDLLVVAIIGTTSIYPTYKAIQAGISIRLACKEVLVSAGHEIMSLARKHNVSILPIDSEHVAIHQCLSGQQVSDVERFILTASGGPFWQRDPKTFDTIRKQDALKHPNWEMGAKITIDSATMMNKGLEVIEAYHLFGLPIEQIDVTVHPQSIIHSLVEFKDGNMIAHLGLPDMRYAIQYSLTYPTKLMAPWPRASVFDFPQLSFFKPNFLAFPLLQCAFDAIKTGGHAPAIMNAANEAAVHLFLEEKIRFVDIAKLVLQALEHHTDSGIHSIEDIVALDKTVKSYVKEQFCAIL